MSKLLEKINKTKELTLGDVCVSFGGGTPSTAVQEYWNGDILWLTPAEISNADFTFISDTKRKITKKGLASSSAKLMPEHSILMSSRANIGDVVINTVPMATNQGFINLIPKKDIVDTVYLSYWLRTRKNYFIQVSTGSTFLELSKSTFREIPIELPDLPTQKKIASILSAYDAKVENNNTIIKNLETTAQTIFNEWFVNFRFPGYEKTKFVESEMGEIPEGWKLVPLNKVAHITMGQSPTSNHYNNDKRGLPFHQGVTYFGERYPDNVIYSTGGEKIAEENDILISVRAPVGRINIATEKTILGRGLGSLKSKEGNSSFLLYLLKNLFHKEDLFGGGSVFPSITKTELEGLEIMSPTTDIVNKFENKVVALDLQIKNLTQENTFLKSQRDQLLAKLI